MTKQLTTAERIADLKKRGKALAGLVAIVGSAMLLFSFVGVLGNQAGGEGIEDALLLDTSPAPGQPSLSVGPKAGNLARNFEVSDFDGNRHRLEDFRGDVVYVTFWASWCGPCRRELPDIQELQIKHPGDLTVIALNRAEPLGRAQDFLDDLTSSSGVRGVTFPVNGLDPDDTLYDEFRGLGMPVSVFIDPDGVITQVHNGLITLEQMEDAFAEANR
jgi:thiol-disulfide isomerase/thioredoxin